MLTDIERSEAGMPGRTSGVRVLDTDEALMLDLLEGSLGVYLADLPDGWSDERVQEDSRGRSRRWDTP